MTAAPMIDGDLLERMYNWSNGLARRELTVTEAEVREFWTDDCVMVINGHTRCVGLTAFAKHFNEIPQKLSSWEVVLPLDMKTIQSGRICAYYRINVVTTDGTAVRVLNGAFYNVRDGKLASMTEVAHYDRRDIR
jgi:hypothetical protein